MNQLISELVLSSPSLRLPNGFHLLQSFLQTTNIPRTLWKGKGRDVGHERDESTGERDGFGGRAIPLVHPKANTLQCKHGLIQRMRLRPPQFRTSPSFIMFSRCIASTATIPKRQSASFATSGVADDVASLRSSMKSWNVDKAWEYYLAVRQREGLSELSHTDVFTLARISTDDSTLSRLGRKRPAVERYIHQGDQLCLLEKDLRECFAKGNDRIAFGSVCIHLQCFALRGKFSEVIPSLDAWSRQIDKSSTHAVGVLRVLLYAICVHESPTSSINFFLENLDLFRRVLARSPGPKGPNSSTDRKGPLMRAFSFSVYQIPDLEHYIEDMVTDLRDDEYGPQSQLTWFVRLLMRVLFNQPKNALQALIAFDEFKRNGVPVEYKVTLELVRALTKAGEFQHANPIFSAISPASNDRRARYEEAGLYLFSRQANVEESQNFYDRLVELRGVQDAFITHLLVANARSGGPNRVVEVFNELFYPRLRPRRDPNHVHFGVVINAFADRHDLEGLSTWISRMTEAGFQPDLVIFNTVMKVFAAREEFESMQNLLDQMRSVGIKPDVTSYTIILSSLARRRDPIAAEEVYRQMIDGGVDPDTVAVATIMNAHVEAGSWGGVIRAFDFFRTTSKSFRQAQLDINIVNTLLKAYVLIGAPLDRVTTIFQSLGASHLKPTEHTFALLIQCACEAGRMDVAARLFVEMERLAGDWTSGLRINAYVMTILMTGYLRLGERSRAKAIYEDMVLRGIEPTSVTFSAIIKSYVNEKSAENIRIAMEFLETITSNPANDPKWTSAKRGFLTSLEHIHNPLLDVFSKNLNAGEAQRLYENLLAIDGGKPTVPSLTLLLDAHRRSGNIEGVMSVWAEIFELGLKFYDSNAVLRADEQIALQRRALRRTDVLAVPLSIYVDAMSARGRHVEIAETWVQMQERGFQFDAHNWNHLVVALVRAGQAERAFHIVENVILEYKSQAEYKARDRREDVDSPLLFETVRDAEVALSEPPIPLDRSLQKRVDLIQKTRHVEIPRSKNEEDYAFDLQILQQISPAWNVWRPHYATLSVLSHALNRLESGRPLAQPTEQNDDDGEAVIREAMETSRRICNKYPRAVRWVYDWERKERYAKQRSQFFDNHTEQRVTNIHYT